MLQKKVHSNPKYSGVKSSINTGASMKNAVTVSDQLIAKRRSEKFKRVKTSTLAKLLGQQYAEESIY